MVERLHDSPAMAASFAPPEAAVDRLAGRVRLPKATPAEVFELVYRQMHKLAAPGEREEIAQVAAEQAIRGLPKFEGRSSLATWTFRICYLTVRKHDRWYRRWLRRFTLTHDGELPEARSQAAAPDERMVSGERVARLRAALASISAKPRAVVVLHDLEGLELSEVAEVVGARIPAVRSRLRDGRKALARLLLDDPYFVLDACRGHEVDR